MRRPKGYPARCECGGKLLYETSCGRVFSCCDMCTPVVVVPRSVWDTYPKRLA